MEGKGRNGPDLRWSNVRSVLRLLYRQKEMTKQDIGRELDLSLPTVTLCLRELIDRGLVRDAGLLSSSGGRKSSRCDRRETARQFIIARPQFRAYSRLA
jgi:DNA-binding IclR family transcriptional regulator